MTHITLHTTEKKTFLGNYIKSIFLFLVRLSFSKYVYFSMWLFTPEFIFRDGVLPLRRLGIFPLGYLLLNISILKTISGYLEWVICILTWTHIFRDGVMHLRRQGIFPSGYLPMYISFKVYFWLSKTGYLYPHPKIY